MKSLSSFFFATVVAVTSTISLNAQSVNSQSGYNSTPSNPSATGNAWNSNASNNQNRTSASTWKSNQSTQGMWDAHVSTSPNHDPNQPYTQPSNLPTSYNDSRDNKFWTWTDEEIAQKIRWSIRDDKSLSTLAKSTEVTVKDKNVTLSGTVDNESEKNRIATIARQTQGVKSVSNNINLTKK